MAILSKIREKSLALIAVVGLALFAFVLDPSTLTDFFNSNKISEVGEVEGKPITRTEYAQAIESYKANTGNRATEMQAAKSVWDNILREKIYTNQLEEAGVTVGETDIWNAIISNQFVQSSAQFKNKAGLFDENAFKQFLNQIQNSEDRNAWNAWSGFLKQIETNLKRNTYTNLVNAGLGASLKEGEFQYKEDNTLFSADFVYIPYKTIPDSLVKVTSKDVETYIKKRSNLYSVEASRDVYFVEFKIEATEKDKENLKTKISKLLEDRKEYSKVTKSEINIEGLKNATDYETFFQENRSDLPYKEHYFTKSDFPKEIQKDAFRKKAGETLEVYEDAGYFKISKILEVVQKPDSVLTSHILVPFVGSSAANDNTTKTEAQAKKSIDSILKLVKNNKKKFAEVAKEINNDGSKNKGGEIGWFRYSQTHSPNFDKDYAEYMHNNRKGKIGIVKTKFGFHIIRIDDQKKKQKIMKLVTYGRQIVASKETENEVFQKAENFALEITSKYETFYDAVKGNDYKAKSAIGLKIFEDNVSGLKGNQRDIVAWAFGKDAKVGKFKRFDIDNGYVVAIVTNKVDEGLMSPEKASGSVKPLLINEKKAELIKKKMNAQTLNEIASLNETTIRKINGVALKSPSITGVGTEPKIIGSMFYAKENQLYNKVAGAKGIFAYVITKKEMPTDVPNYEPFRKRISEDRKNKATKIFEALKTVADIEDNRAFYYGIEQ